MIYHISNIPGFVRSSTESVFGYTNRDEEVWISKGQPPSLVIVHNSRHSRLTIKGFKKTDHGESEPGILSRHDSSFREVVFYNGPELDDCLARDLIKFLMNRAK